MPILQMKPHKLFYLVRTNGYEDENGDYHEGKSEWVFFSRCDAIPNGKEESIVYDDGVVGKYTYTVKLPVTCKNLKKGDRVKIEFFSSCKALDFDVLGFHRYQHQCKLWV